MLVHLTNSGTPVDDFDEMSANDQKIAADVP